MRDPLNERARARHGFLGINALMLLAFALGVGVGGWPYKPHVDYWQIALAVACAALAAACAIAGFVVLERDTRRLRKIGAGLRARREAFELQRNSYDGYCA